ncbi:MAG: hypothetical protein Q8P10_02875 [bacterium]|nr:hypothetical protein [bacterium]
MKNIRETRVKVGDFIENQINRSWRAKEILEAETRIRDIIASAEGMGLEIGLKNNETEQKMRRVAGNRSGMCSFFPDMVRYCVEKTGGNNVTHKTDYIHRFYRGFDDGYCLGHAFNLVTINGIKFLVDLSFCQYVKPDGIASQYKPGDYELPDLIRLARFKGYKNPNHPLAQKLIIDGYVLPENRTFRDYLDIATYDRPKYLKTAKVTDLDRVKPCHQEWSNQAIEKELNKN